MTVNGEKLVCGSIKGCLNCKYADCISKGRKIYAVSEEQRKRNNERQKQRKQERRENGICTSCGKRPADAGRKMCGICRERYRQYKEDENRRKGIVPRDALGGENGHGAEFYRTETKTSRTGRGSRQESVQPF